jgi:hypothetical protein
MCQVVSAAATAIVDCMQRLVAGDTFTVAFTPVNNGAVTACWDPANVCIVAATAVPEPNAWLMLIAGLFSVGLLVRARPRLAGNRRTKPSGSAWRPNAV